MLGSKSVDKVNKFLKKSGWNPLDENNKSMLRKGNASLAVVAIPGKDLLLVSSPVISLPEENLLPLFRKLLTLNFGETKDAAFALNEEVGTIDLQIKRPLENLDYNEFSRAVETVAVVADQYNDILGQDFSAELIEPEAPKISAWEHYVTAINPMGVVARKVDLKSRVQRIRAVFGVLGFAAGIGGAIYAYRLSGSWALAIFSYIWVAWGVARAIPSLITDPYKFRRLIFFALYPGGATVVLYFTYGWWQMWWLSVILGLLAGWFVPPVIAAIFMRQIFVEEAMEDQERMGAWVKAQGGGE